MFPFSDLLQFCCEFQFHPSIHFPTTNTNWMFRQTFWLTVQSKHFKNRCTSKYHESCGFANACFPDLSFYSLTIFKVYQTVFSKHFTNEVLVLQWPILIFHFHTTQVNYLYNYNYILVQFSKWVLCLYFEESRTRFCFEN